MLKKVLIIIPEIFIYVCIYIYIIYMYIYTEVGEGSTLAWKIPWTEEPGRLQSMGSLRAGHD